MTSETHSLIQVASQIIELSIDAGKEQEVDLQSRLTLLLRETAGASIEQAPLLMHDIPKRDYTETMFRLRARVLPVFDAAYPDARFWWAGRDWSAAEILTALMHSGAEVISLQRDT